jgi:hypothetical protein
MAILMESLYNRFGTFGEFRISNLEDGLNGKCGDNESKMIYENI